MPVFVVTEQKNDYGNPFAGYHVSSNRIWNFMTNFMFVKYVYGNGDSGTKNKKCA